MLNVKKCLGAIILRFLIAEMDLLGGGGGGGCTHPSLGQRGCWGRSAIFHDKDKKY